MTKLRTRPVVALCHGFLGFDRMGAGPAIIKYWPGLSTALDSVGVDVVECKVPPVSSIARRAQALHSQVTTLPDDRPLHLIGHSMGGLDARHMISHLLPPGRVRTLTTVGTPHRGSALACLFGRPLERFGLFEAAARWQVDVAALAQLMPQYLEEEFNPATPDVAETRYYWLAGSFPEERHPPPLRQLARYLRDEEKGPNDGLVSVASAEWGTECGVVEADHNELVNWHMPGRPPRFDALAWYRTHVADLIRGEGAEVSAQ